MISRGVALFMEMGTGKTKAVIDSLEIMFACGLISKVLVISPLSVIESWGGDRGELATHSSKSFWHILLGNKSKRKKILDTNIRKIRLNWFLINVDGVSIIKEELEDFNPDVVIIDESTTIKNRITKRTKIIIELFQRAPYKIIMSGNPIPKTAVEIFAQYKFTEPGIFGTNFSKFTDRFFELDYFNKMIAFKDEVMFNKLFHELSFRRSKEECLTLPPKIYQEELIDMSIEQGRLYKEMHDDAVTSLNDETLSAPVVITKILRLSQIAGGLWPKEDKTIKFLNPNPKLLRLIEIIDEEIPKKEQIVIWARFKGEIKLISKALDECGYKNKMFFGETSVADRKEIGNAFQDKKIRCFVGNAATGGLGINFLKECNNVIYYSNDYSSEKRQQSEDRTHRSGTKGDHVLYKDLLMKDTIDVGVLRVLRDNKDFSDQILNKSVKL